MIKIFDLIIVIACVVIIALTIGHYIRKSKNKKGCSSYGCSSCDGCPLSGSKKDDKQ